MQEIHLVEGTSQRLVQSLDLEAQGAGRADIDAEATTGAVVGADVRIERLRSAADGHIQDMRHHADLVAVPLVVAALHVVLHP